MADAPVGAAASGPKVLAADAPDEASIDDAQTLPACVSDEDSDDRSEDFSADAGRPDAAVGSDDTSPQAAATEPAQTKAQETTQVHPLVQSLVLNPTRWRLWPAVAVLRWMERRAILTGRIVGYRSNPALKFAGSEIDDIRFQPDRVSIVLNAVGLACAGSPLPASDIARIIADTRNQGALNEWLDGVCDRFMHALESMQAQCHTPFAIATGGKIEAHALVADLAGRTTPLSAAPNGAIYHGLEPEPVGAIGLARTIIGPRSARGMEALFAAFTGLAVRVKEFTGAEIDIARPARLGGRIGRMLGRRCRSPEAGVEVHLEGGGDEDARSWAIDRVRRRSLHALAMNYVGTGTPAVHFVLWLDPETVPEGRLDGLMALGGMAVMGPATTPVALPIEIGAG